MPRVTISRQDFLQDRQGRTFADVLNAPEQPLDAVLEFFNVEASRLIQTQSAAWYVPIGLCNCSRLSSNCGCGAGFVFNDESLSQPRGESFGDKACTSIARCPGRRVPTVPGHPPGR